MSIIPENITTVRVDQLPNEPATLSSLLPHQVGPDLKQTSVSDFITLVATAIESGSGVGFLPVSVSDGQTLPPIPENPSFILVGAGTFGNLDGFPDLVCTENLNALITVDTHWEISVEIPITPLTGSVQSVTGSAVDNTDPLNPIINSTGGSGSTSTLQEVTEAGEETTVKTIFRTSATEWVEIGGDNNGIAVYNDVFGTLPTPKKIIEIAYNGLGISTYDPSTGEQTGAAGIGDKQLAAAEVVGGVQGKSTLIEPDKIVKGIDGSTYFDSFLPSEDNDLNGSKVISANTTAKNAINYLAVANLTMTDITPPSEGVFYEVTVINGTATIGGVGYTAGQKIFRHFHSGSWRTFVSQNANSLSKIVIKDAVSSAPVTGSTLNTLAKTYQIQGGTFDGNDAFNLEINAEKNGVLGMTTIRVYVNTTNNFATATLYSTTSSPAAAVRDIPSSRSRSNFKGTNLMVVTPGSGLLNDLNQGFNAPRTAIPLNPANTFFVFVAIQNANAGDSTTIESVHLTT